MSIDLILAAPTVADMRNFLVARNLITLVDLVDENEQPISGKNIETREGFYFVPWAGDVKNTATGVQVSGGSLQTKAWDIQATQSVALSQAYEPAIPATFSTPTEIDETPVELTPRVPAVPAEFAFNVGGNPPAWLDATDAEGNFTTVALRDMKAVGRFNRIQGNFAVFSGVADVAEDLQVALPDPQFLNQFVILAHIHGSFFNDDRISDGITGEENEVVEQWQKSALIRTIRNAATPITVAGDIQGYDWAGVKLFRAADVQAFLASRGVPGHEWLGGNSY